MSLQESSEDLLRKVIPSILNKRLNRYQIELTETQLADLLNAIDGEKMVSVSIELTDEQQQTLNAQNVRAEEAFDFAAIEVEIEQELDKLTQASMVEATDEASAKLYADWIALLPNELVRIKEDEDQYLVHLRERWGEILDMMRGHIDICTTLGSDFNNVFRPQAAEENDLLFEVLVSAHARCCQISAEIHTLLVNGYPDGAFARWRTLNEQSTIALVVFNGGTDLANRYLLHANISRYKRACLYNKYCERLGFPPIPDEQIQVLKATYDDLIVKFGKTYAEDYGWACEFLNKKRPNFSDIEERRNSEHLRPYIKLSHLSVHGSSEGLYHRVGASPADNRTLGAGMSYFGLGDPLQNTVLEMNALTINMLISKPSLDRTAISKALQSYTNKMLEKLIEVLDRNPELRYDQPRP